jgi:hypothetical protein
LAYALVEACSAQSDVLALRLRDGLAHVPGLPLGELVEARLDAVGDPTEQPLPLGRRRRRPGLERTPRRTYGPVDVLGAALGDDRDRGVVDR